MALAPLACGSVWAADEHSNCRERDDDEWHDECHPPCDMSSEMLILNQRVEYSRHQKVGNTASGIAKAPSERIGCPDNVLVKEARSPDLAWHEATTKDTHEKTESH